MKNKSGFTLIEIIVVLVIVGILAAIAIPILFSNIAKSRSAEAVILLGFLRTQVEGCQQGHNATAANDCLFGNVGGVNDPSTVNFTITMPVPPANDANNAAQTYTLLATSTANGGLDTITMVRLPGGANTCTGTGIFVGAC